MQTQKRKILFFLFLFHLLIPKLSVSQHFNSDQKKADSLYSTNKFSEALKIYENELIADHRVPLRNILKIARIHEGLQNYGQSMYYLSLYRKITGDEKVQEKIIELSRQNNFQGYESSDLLLVKNYMRSYERGIVYTLCVIILLCFLIGVYRIFVAHSSGTRYLVIALVFCFINFTFLLLSKEKSYGFISMDHSLIMEEPSAGANLLASCEPGHKVTVLEQSDIWSKIEWNGSTGFIRTKNLILFSE